MKLLRRLWSDIPRRFVFVRAFFLTSSGSVISAHVHKCRGEGAGVLVACRTAYSAIYDALEGAGQRMSSSVPIFPGRGGRVLLSSLWPIYRDMLETSPKRLCVHHGRSGEHYADHGLPRDLRCSTALSKKPPGERSRVAYEIDSLML